MRTAKLFMAAVLCLMASLLHANQSSVPPHGDGPLQIKTSVYIVDLQSINNARQSYTGNVFYSLSWQDPRLVHEGPGDITLSLKEVWHPNVQVLNRQRVFLTFPDEAQVSPNGKVIIRQRLWGDFTQAMDLHDFPFDSHQFNLDMVIIGHSPEMVIMVTDSVEESRVVEDYTLPDWTIKGWNAGPMEYRPLPNESIVISGFRFSFEAERNTTFYLLKVILPLLLLAALSWLVFWISIEESSIQVSVAITTILTLIAYRFAIGSALPAVSYLTRMDSMILGATVVTFAALGMVVVIQALRRADRTQLAVRVQRWCRVVFPGLLIWGVLEWLVL